MITEKIHHIYDSNNHVLAHNLSSEELEEQLDTIIEPIEIVSLDPPSYKEASY